MYIDVHCQHDYLNDRASADRCLMHWVQEDLTKQWRGEKDDMERLQSVKEEIDRVNLEIQGAERDYDLNRAAELKYGTLLDLQKQLKEAEVALEQQVRLLDCFGGFVCTRGFFVNFILHSGLSQLFVYCCSGSFKLQLHVLQSLHKTKQSSNATEVSTSSAGAFIGICCGCCSL